MCVFQDLGITNIRILSTEYPSIAGMLRKMDENHYLWKTDRKIMHCLFKTLLPVLFLAAACGNPAATPFEPAPDAVVIPFQGNVFVTETPGSFYGEAPRIIDTRNSRLQSWNDPEKPAPGFPGHAAGRNGVQRIRLPLQRDHPQGPRDRPRNL